MDIMGMMKKAQEMQAKMAGIQDELANTVVQGSAGGGMVNLTLTAKGELRGIKIDPSLLKPDEGQILEDLILAAHADAKAKAEAETTARMAEMTAGLPLPPGMKFPF